jgi:PhnB protein
MTDTSTETIPAEIDKGAIMGGVIPYLTLDTDAGEAIAFYERAFGAVLADDPARSEDGKVLNATLAINGGAFMLMDRMGWSTGTAQGGKGVLLQLVVADGDAWWSRAVEAGCKVTDPFEMKSWGDRFGCLRDPMGQDWAILEPSPERRGMNAPERTEGDRS